MAYIPSEPQPISAVKMSNDTPWTATEAERTAVDQARRILLDDGTQINAIDTPDIAMFDPDFSLMNAVSTYPVLSSTLDSNNNFVFLPGDYRVKLHVSWSMRQGNVVPTNYVNNPQFAAYTVAAYAYNTVLGHTYQHTTSANENNLDFYIIGDIRFGQERLFGIDINWSSHKHYFAGVNSWKVEIFKYPDGSL